MGYILNVTREIDNFFPGNFEYFNVRLYDLDSSELMKHWHKTYKFIKRAKYVILPLSCCHLSVASAFLAHLIMYTSRSLV